MYDRHDIVTVLSVYLSLSHLILPFSRISLSLLHSLIIRLGRITLEHRFFNIERCCLELWRKLRLQANLVISRVVPEKETNFFLRICDRRKIGLSTLFLVSFTRTPPSTCTRNQRLFPFPSFLSFLPFFFFVFFFFLFFKVNLAPFLWKKKTWLGSFN